MLSNFIKIEILAFSLFYCFSCPVISSTKDTIRAAQDLPLKIDSDQGISCDRNRNTCTAKGNVIAQKGIYLLYCDTLTTYMRKNKETGKQEIWKIHALGNVRLTGAVGESATGHQGVYVVSSGKFTLLGDLECKDDKGYGFIIKDTYLLKARKIILHVGQKNANNTRQIEFIEAHDEVILSSPDEIGYGDYATYKPESKLATLNGKAVTIVREEGRLEGTYAEVNMETGISRMVNNPKKRVHAFINPQKVKKQSFIASLPNRSDDDE